MKKLLDHVLNIVELSQVRCVLKLLNSEAVMRRCAMYCIALAYVGSSQNGALKKLLHVAVSDVSDDVRRAAVEAIGFVMFRLVNNILVK